jgi:hypothetical protein
MVRRLATLVLGGVWLAASSACGPQPDLQTSLDVVPGITGYADDGVQPDGQNRILPSITFQLKNEGDLPIANVNLVLVFWPAGKDVDLGSTQVRGIGSDPLAPGATSESMTVQSSLGYTSPYPRSEFFTRPQFVDVVVRMFAKRRGSSVPIGEFPIERRLLPTTRPDGDAK